MDETQKDKKKRPTKKESARRLFLINKIIPIDIDIYTTRDENTNTNNVIICNANEMSRGRRARREDGDGDEKSAIRANESAGDAVSVSGTRI